MFDKPATSLVIQQWEEAGTSLATALSKYFHLSLTLGANISREDPSDLATRIDLALHNLHVTLGQQVSQARSALASARNRIRSAINRLPNEILSEIFAHVVHQPLNPLEPVPMRQSLLTTYRLIRDLLSVCSVWKKVVLARGSFWSMIPIIPPASLACRAYGHLDPTELCIGRAQGRDLHLAAIIIPNVCEPDELPSLIQHAHRFRSINIVSESPYSITPILYNFGKLGSSGKLSELSIHCKHEDSRRNMVPRAHHYMFPPGRSDRTFRKLLKRISVLRLSGAPLDWNGISFSKSLVKLELQDFTLGYDSELSKLMTALSSATRLKHLKIITVKTFPDNRTLIPIEEISKVSLPSLKTFLIRDLFFNTLRYLLSSISSCSHRLFLHLTRKTFQVVRHEAEEPEDSFSGEAADFFHGVTADTLLLERGGDNSWLVDYEMSDILYAMPDITTLKMHGWDYDTEFCTAIHCTVLKGGIKRMCFSQARIHDEVAFKSMVASYSESLERMKLGAVIGDNSEFTDEHYPVEKDQDLDIWLEENVPDFELLDEYHSPADFLPPKWQLW